MNLRIFRIIPPRPPQVRPSHLDVHEAVLEMRKLRQELRDALNELSGPSSVPKVRVLVRRAAAGDD